MDKLYIIVFLIGEKYFYTIWKDSIFILDDTKEKIIKFENLEKLKEFCNSNNYDLDESISYIDCNQEKLLDFDNFSCNDVLDFWNILTDISKTLNISFKGDDTNDDYINSVYNKLFSGCNLCSNMGDRKRLYIPFWTARHKYILRMVIKEGIEIIKREIGQI